MYKRVEPILINENTWVEINEGYLVLFQVSRVDGQTRHIVIDDEGKEKLLKALK
ncbi:hypothetical protein ACQKIY_25145 [Bacillus mycoides]|uniref:hypothetical protein n=1 Tax=Bacillus mycoides TaxID=1405 RepID=UPI003D00FA7A